LTTKRADASQLTGSEAKGLRELLLGQVGEDDVVSHIGLNEANGVAVVTLAREQQHNVLSLASWRRLHSIFLDLALSPKLRAVVVRGAGSKAFGAGADIKEFPEVRLTPELALTYNEAIASTLRAVAALPVPVIAMIGGLAVGGGCELAAACDVRIASSHARFGIPIGRLGVTLGYAEASTVAQLIGPAALKYLLFSGRLIPAEQALQVGLVQVVVEPAELVDETLALVQGIVASSEVTIRAAKLVVDMAGRTLTAADTELITRLAVEAYGGADLKEGVAAFEARRPPQFTSKERTTHVGS
jgi:enoyl-CoA hydratase